jgi:ubiquinone/menaquinone biosynthesis C-methylase UbiE
MHVLDIGCGVGDVSMLVADAVGPSGAVVGVDREQRAIETARSRADKAGYRRLEFAVGSDQNIEHLRPFDAAIGRYVLIHQSDPTAMVRRVAAAVKPGGIVAFMEPALHVDVQQMPSVDLTRIMIESMAKLYPIALPSYNIAGRIVVCFQNAGLPEPRVLWESIVPRSDQLYYFEWLVASYIALLPHLERCGFVNSEVGNKSTLYDRILTASRRARAQMAGFPQVSAWAIRQ